MKEVSCRVLNVLFMELKRQKQPPELLSAGTGYTAAQLRDKNVRIEWDAFLVLMQNARKMWTDDDLVRIGGGFTSNPLVRYMGIIARLLFDAKQLFAWMTSDGTGGGPQMFSNIKNHFIDRGEREITIELRLADGYRPCREFFVTTKGGFKSFPRFLGLPEAQVEMIETDRGARYDIVVPAGGGGLRRFFRRIFGVPLAARQAAKELKDAHEQLQERYAELEQAQQELDRQATRLRVAHDIGSVIHSELDLDKTVAAVAKALVDVARFAAVEVTLDLELEGRRVERRAAFGAPPPAALRLEQPLVAHARTVGVLVVHPAAGADIAERRDLLEFIASTVAMALNDAISFYVLSHYREDLEQKVTERTTDLARARDDLAAALAEMKEVQAARDRIFANINHEIRTPLSLVMLAVADLRQRLGSTLDQRSEQVLDSISSSVRRLLRLIDGLLLLAAGQEGKLVLRPEACDIGAALDQIVTAWLPAAEQHGLRLVYEGPRRCSVDVDIAAFERIVTNLVSNAIKFTPAGGSIEVQLNERDDGKVDVAVRDSGIGIDEEFRQRIFGRFEQGRPAVHAGAQGSGIGLSVVKQLAEGHGGSVGVESPRLGGSIFRVVLPRRQSDGATAAAAAVRPAAEPKLRLAPVDFGQRKSDIAPAPVIAPADDDSILATILVAEDEPELRMAIARSLGERYRVLLAGDGITALHLAKKHGPDLLISDVGMPGMDGLELTRRFRALPGNNLAPVVLLTAFADLSDRLSGFDAGALDYITKPFAPEELRARVRSQLALRDMALRLHQSEKLAGLGTLSAGLAHELRNPANALVNAVPPLRSLLPKDVIAPGQPAAQLLDVLESCAHQIGVLSKQLLGFKRPGELLREDLPLAAVLGRALAVVEPVLRGVTLKKDLTYPGTIPCALPLLAQVFTNLLENAAHAAGDGGWVRVTDRVEDGRVIIDVSDSGPGVPVDLREKIFEPFFTTKPPGKGTGLGLTTSREIVERHGGTLAVRTDAEGRSVFRVELPLSAPGAAAAQPWLRKAGA